VQNEFLRRSHYWKNVFDWETDFMRARQNGNWYSPFDPFEVNFHYTEANAWQYLFAVQHDIPGLIQRMGDEKNFSKKLDELFSATATTTGREQPDISGMLGQYAHGNEPSHHVSFLYNYCGQYWKTQDLNRKIRSEFYFNAPDGLIGNEDCGQMSAWYIWSAMGLYPHAPGAPEYTFSSPLFKTITIHTGAGRNITLRAKNYSPKNQIANEWHVNGKIAASLTITHNELMDGTIEFIMSNSVDSSVIYPFSEKNKETRLPEFLMSPVIESGGRVFKDSMLLVFKSYDDVRFQLHNGSQIQIVQNDSMMIFKSEAITVSALSESGNSKPVNAEFKRAEHLLKAVYKTPYSPLYTGGGNQALTDGIAGIVNFKGGTFQGWWGTDMEVDFDLGNESLLKKVSAGFLQDQKSWILLPSQVEFLSSIDGINFTPVATLHHSVDEKEEIVYRILQSEIRPVKCRYVKIIARNYGTLPSWHQGAGGQAWIFCDEVVLNHSQ
jgi:hypothetical protein